MSVRTVLVALLVFIPAKLAAEPFVAQGEFVIHLSDDADQVVSHSSSPAVVALSGKRRGLLRSIHRRRKAFLLKAEELSTRSRIPRSERRIVPLAESDNLCPELLRDPEVETCTPNFVISAQVTPDDSYFRSECSSDDCSCEGTVSRDGNCLWGLHNENDTDINAPEAWELSTGSTKNIVAVIDSGIDYRHPDLAANVWRNPGEIPGNGLDDDGNGWVDDVYGVSTAGAAKSGDPKDGNGHGTHVAGTIAAVGNNGYGIAGVSWSTKVMGVRILDPRGFGTYADAIEGISYVTQMKRDFGHPIIAMNISWGGTIPRTLLEGNSGLRAVFEDAAEAGILVVVAVGNGDQNGVGQNIDLQPHYPASLNMPNMINVAAQDVDGRLAPFSNFGSFSVHLAAPGVNILSLIVPDVLFPGGPADPTNHFALASGTSMAAPHVTGVLALLAARYPDSSPLEWRDRLLNRVRPFACLEDSSRLVTGGSANAYFALTDAPISAETLASCTTGDDPLSGSVGDYDLVVRGRRKTRAKRNQLRRDTLFSGGQFVVRGTSRSAESAPELLQLQFSFSDRACVDHSVSLVTNRRGRFRVRGRLRRMPLGLQEFTVRLFDSHGNLRGETSGAVRGPRRRIDSGGTGYRCSRLRVR